MTQDAKWFEIMEIIERMEKEFDYMVYLEKDCCEVEGPQYFQKYDYSEYTSPKRAVQVALTAFAYWYRCNKDILGCGCVAPAKTNTIERQTR